MSDPLHLILLGAPGAGKGTQAVTVSRELGLAHIASGDLFRQAQERGTELGNIAKSYMEKGLLVPDEVTIGMVQERIAEADCVPGFILDGFPRTLGQAQALDGVLEAQGKRIDKALYIKVGEEELLRRLGGRWICRQCQAPYHMIDLPPLKAGQCDHCGGELYQRADDTMDTARKRLEVYFLQTSPLIEYYAGQGKLMEIDGKQGVEAVARELLAAVR